MEFVTGMSCKSQIQHNKTKKGWAIENRFSVQDLKLPYILFIVLKNLTNDITVLATLKWMPCKEERF